ncbi:M23 family metallopeptidase [Antrihabitans cavernicola]|uniref:Peptidoglycan DD-metalloendopeptidase family protein n=1 Tax=Antrihabitans cavernicola TaxID=2495913 RepID=A0A5A7SBQ9_9NOCA|nr:M23 family metallopeptidase [Spelaeibacter cavernicola]KAA0021915.1 peptidoglycan DD-metalloendopeptidase family protein [Spelaeibacter cavernicola]
MRTIEGPSVEVGRFRVLGAVLVAAALFAAADAVHSPVVPMTFASAHTVAPGIYQNAANVQPLDLEHQQQVLMTPRTRPEYLDQLAKGEKIREGHVVETAAKATLERAKAEAAAAIAGQTPQSMMGGSATMAGAITPGSNGYVVPAHGTFTSGFGMRWGVLHAGIDIAGPIGTPEYAVAAGTVIDAGPASGFGLWVRIRHDDGTISVYGHMYDFFVSVGERVPAGMQIARMGSRGDSTGPHLHFEIIINGQHVDPQRWLALHGIMVG